MSDVWRLRVKASTNDDQSQTIRVYRSYRHPDIRTRLWRRLAEEYENLSKDNSRFGRDSVLNHMLDILANWKGSFQFPDGTAHDPVRHYPSSKTILNFIKFFDNTKTVNDGTLRFIHCFLLAVDSSTASFDSPDQELEMIKHMYIKRYLSFYSSDLMDALLLTCRRLSGIYVPPEVSIPALVKNSKFRNSYSRPLLYIEGIENAPLVKVHIIYDARKSSSYSNALVYDENPDQGRDIPLRRASGIAVPFINDRVGLSFTFILSRKTHPGAPIIFRSQFNSWFPHYFALSHRLDPYVVWTCRKIGESLPDPQEEDAYIANHDRLFLKYLEPSDSTTSAVMGSGFLEQLDSHEFDGENSKIFLSDAEIESEHHGSRETPPGFIDPFVSHDARKLGSFVFDDNNIRHFIIEEVGTPFRCAFIRHESISSYWQELLESFGGDV